MLLQGIPHPGGVTWTEIPAGVQDSPMSPLLMAYRHSCTAARCAGHWSRQPLEGFDPCPKVQGKLGAAITAPAGDYGFSWGWCWEQNVCLQWLLRVDDADPDADVDVDADTEVDVDVADVAVAVAVAASQKELLQPGPHNYVVVLSGITIIA